MKLREIINTWSSTGFPDSYRYHFKNTARSPAFGTLELSEKLDDETHVLGLFDGEILVSFLNLEIRDTPYFQIVYSATSPEYLRKGCFRFLLNAAIDVHGTVLSDNHHTPEAKMTWQSLIKNPGGTMTIYVYNSEEDTRIPTRNVPMETIWNDKAEPILMATNSNFTTEELRKAKRFSSNMLEHGRDYNFIWYGDNNQDGGI